MRYFKVLILVAVSILLIYFLDKGFGSLPPLGRVTDPVHGFMANAETKHDFESIELSSSSKEIKGNVYLDERLVPHIYAEDEWSLYFLQGFVTAKYRMWQMDIQTRAAAGRLSEIFGSKFINYDIEQRRKGMVYAAEKALIQMQNDPVMLKCVQAYTDGINEFMQAPDNDEINLPYASYPIEFKLLNYKPEKWTLLKTALLLTYMSNTLTGFDDDIEYSNLLKLLGEENFNLLYPNRPAGIDPIIPSEKKYDFIPTFNDTTKQIVNNHYFEDVMHIFSPKPEKNQVGSNNWVVGANKTKNGNPILCNDPHLQLNLPSLWFEIQLNAPGINCYGVSLPGAPAIVIGFNDSIAWGVTNAQIDVRDWYTIEFKDQSKKEYKFGDVWKPTTKRIEEINVKGGTVVIDTVIYTHYGPLVYHGNEKNLEGKTNPEIIQRANMVMRWAALDPGQELKTFYLLNRAKNYDDYRAALNFYNCPAQNFIFGSSNGDIAITQQGKFPIKYPGQGRMVLNGSDPVNDYINFIPFDQNPFIKNPEIGFCASANQHPTDSTYPYYYTSFDFEYYRNRVINNALKEMNNITVDDMQNLQQNTFNMMASEVLPQMINMILNTEGEILSSTEFESITISGSLTISGSKIFSELKNWDYNNDAKIPAPTYFQIWWDTLYNSMWDEMYDEEIALVKPNYYNTIQAIKHFPSDYKYFDIKSTPGKELLADLIVNSYISMLHTVDSLFKIDSTFSAWYKYKNTNIMHISQIPAFSKTTIHNGGNKNIVNATSKTHGPSWRMVVELSNPINAYGVYPGGQSGNPGSKYFDNFIDDWASGKYYKLNFYSSEEEAKKHSQFSIMFK